MTPLVMDARSDESVCRVANVFKNGSIRLEIPPDATSGTVNQPREEPNPTRDSCFLLKVMLPGYRSYSGNVRDQQVIVLSRLGEHEGSTVSVTSLSAPEKAKKAFERAESAVSRQKWPVAQRYFERATSLYPAYAMAWSDLGTTMEAQGRTDDAATAYHKAADADPKYIKPLVQLAGLAGKQQHWEVERQNAALALKLHPVEFPSVYFYLAEANFQLGHYVEAEEAARGAIEIDQHHEFPQVYLLLAAVQAQKGDRDAAAKS
jgi:Flp pilus assembly protein TadD